MIIICAQTGDVSIAESCLQTNIPRAQDIFQRGQQQQHHGILQVTVSKFTRSETEDSSGPAQVKSYEQKTGGGGGGQGPQQ